MKFHRRGRATGAVLLMAVLGMLTVAVPAAPATAPHPAPVPMERGTPEAFALHWGNDRQTQARMLRGAVNPNGARVTMGSMLDAADRNAQTQNNAGCRNRATGSGGALQGIPFAALYCLNPQDTITGDWTPQGISGTEDARTGGTVDGHKAIVFSWHAGSPGDATPPPGTRLSFLDTVTHRYIHTLLVEPNQAGNNYGEVSVHAGGIVWYQNHIFVADNQRGIHVYDTTNLLQLARNPKGSTGPTCPTGRQPGPNGKYCGRGYDYLLPEIGRWNNPNSSTTRYDSMSLERNPDDPNFAPVFITSEYRTSRVGQVVRWSNADMTSFRNTIHPFRAWMQPVRYVQGAFSRSCYYFNTGGGGSGNRDLVIANATGNRTPTSQVGGRGLQDLYWLHSVDQLWTLTEHAGEGKRVLYGVSRPACP